MRPAVSFGDLVQFTRFALQFRPKSRRHHCKSLISKAIAAKEYLQITGQLHPLYGDGTLGGLAMRSGMAPLKYGLTPDVLQAFEIVLEEVKAYLSDAPAPDV